MKTYCVFLLITSLLPLASNQVAVLPSAQAVELPGVVKNISTTAYQPPRVGVPGRREGGGTR
jgi:hypothetical protein